MWKTTQRLSWMALAAAGCTMAPDPAPHGNPLSDGTGVTRYFGSVGDGRLGLPVAGGQDCDGDRRLDLAFAAIQASPLQRERAGEVVVLFGDGTIGGTVDTAGFAGDRLRIAGEQPYEVTGSELWMDDITGDGVADLIICRQNHTPDIGRAGAGAVTVLLGGPALRAAAGLQRYLDLGAVPDDIAVVHVTGPAAYDRLGIWARTGDIDGDGVADLVIGADEIDAPDEPNRGAAFVLRGGSHLAAGLAIDLAEFGATAAEGHLARLDPPAGAVSYHFGATCQIADLDGNGRAEVLVAAALERGGASLRLPDAPPGTGESGGGAPRGTVTIVWDDAWPTAPWPAGYRFVAEAPPQGAATVISGPRFSRTFGEELLGGFDIDGDTRPELFVGDLLADAGNGLISGAGFVLYDAGRFRDRIIDLLAPPADVRMTTILGPVPAALGGDTATTGDYDGDGLTDLMFGSPHDSPANRTFAGSVHVIYGRAGGWPDEINLFPTELPSMAEVRIARINGAHGTRGDDTGDTLGYSAASGDLNGDGQWDLIVNEMTGNGVDAGAVDVGNVLVISGAALLPAPDAP